MTSAVASCAVGTDPRSNRALPVLGRASGPVALVAVLAALGLGAVVAVQPVLGVAAMAGLVLVAVAARDLPTAVVVWVPTLFLEGVPALNAAGKAGGLVLLATWALQQRRLGAGTLDVLVRHRRLLSLLLLVLAWATLSVLWSPDWRLAASELTRWFAVAILFAVVATTVQELVVMRRLMVSFVVGGVAAVLVSLTEAGSLSGMSEVRLGSAAGDPNFLGSWLLAGLLLGLGLVATTRRPSALLVLAAAMLLMAAGMGLTLSRGAFVSSALTALVALVLLRHRRRWVLLTAATAALGVAVWLGSSPSALDRLGDVSGGSGRSDLWTVAVHMSADNPVLGVGLEGFTQQADVYMREVGPIQTSYLISRKQPDEVHNVYLQLLAEGGPPALLLLLGFAVACVVTTLRAARRFDARGARGAATLVYSVVLAQAALLMAALFLSSAVDKRLWIALALGPAADVLSRRPVPGSRLAPSA